MNRRSLFRRALGAAAAALGLKALPEAEARALPFRIPYSDSADILVGHEGGIGIPYPPLDLPDVEPFHFNCRCAVPASLIDAPIP